VIWRDGGGGEGRVKGGGDRRRGGGGGGRRGSVTWGFVLKKHSAWSLAHKGTTNGIEFLGRPEERGVEMM